MPFRNTLVYSYIYYIFFLAGGIINSTSAMHNENFVRHASSKISLKRVPPSYSTVLKLGIPLPQYDSRTFSSVPFITRQPPPSYAEVHGRWDDNSLSMVSCKFYTVFPYNKSLPSRRLRVISSQPVKSYI